MSDLMRIGSSAMNAAYLQLQTTGQNIANASTPGYVRREVVLQEAGDMTGDGWAGRGVEAVTARRVYNEFLVRDSVSSKAAAAQDSARSEGLSRMDQLFADPQSGVGAAFDDLVSAFSDVTARPADASARSVVLSRAETFASRVTTIDTRLLELRQTAVTRMQSDVGRANDTLAALATINQRLSQSRGGGGEPNALLDERDRLLGELNGLMRATATFGQDGTITVSSQRGDPLVVGGEAARLSLAADPLDPSSLGITIRRSAEAATTMSAGEVGGSLAGMMRFAGADIDAARAQLGRMTAAVAGAFNARQTSGLDATGQPGQSLFAVGAPAVVAATNVTGDARFQVSVSDASALKASDYTIEFDGTQYALTRLSDGTVQSLSSLPATIDGLSVSLESGQPAAGDRFMVRAATAFAAGTRTLQTNPARIATALPVIAEAGASNSGDLHAAALDTGPAADVVAQPVTITFTGPGTFSVSGTGTGNPTGLTYTPGMQVSYNGWTATLRGSPAAGDTLRIGPTPNPGADNRNALAMQALGDAKFADGATAIDRYAELVGDVGSRTQSAASATQMSKRLYEDAEQSRNALSGVNLDEEAARLMQYQQAYQAAAKVISAANEMFRLLLDAAGN